MKTCTCCKLLKENSEFSKNRHRLDGLQDWCRSCFCVARKKLGPDGLTSQQRFFKNHPEPRTNEDGLNIKQQWYARNLDLIRDRKLWRKYRITRQDFDLMLDKQGGACAICKDLNIKLGVDHDHKTGRVRAILCNSCNMAIGFLGDSAKLATAVAEYLTLHGNP